TAVAMLLISRSAGVLANHNHPQSLVWLGHVVERFWNLSVVRHVYAPLFFSQTDQSSRANIHPSFFLISAWLNPYPSSPVKNCGSPFPKLQSAAEFSIIATTTSLGAIETELANCSVNSL